MSKKQGDQCSYGKETRRSVELCKRNWENSVVMVKKHGDQWSYGKKTERSEELW